MAVGARGGGGGGGSSGGSGGSAALASFTTNVRCAAFTPCGGFLVTAVERSWPQPRTYSADGMHCALLLWGWQGGGLSGRLLAALAADQAAWDASQLCASALEVGSAAGGGAARYADANEAAAEEAVELAVERGARDGSSSIRSDSPHSYVSGAQDDSGEADGGDSARSLQQPTVEALPAPASAASGPTAQSIAPTTLSALSAVAVPAAAGGIGSSAPPLSAGGLTQAPSQLILRAVLEPYRPPTAGSDEGSSAGDTAIAAAAAPRSLGGSSRAQRGARTVAGAEPLSGAPPLPDETYRPSSADIFAAAAAYAAVTDAAPRARIAAAGSYVSGRGGAYVASGDVDSSGGGEHVGAAARAALAAARAHSAPSDFLELPAALFSHSAQIATGGGDAPRASSPLHVPSRSPSPPPLPPFVAASVCTPAHAIRSRHASSPPPLVEMPSSSAVESPRHSPLRPSAMAAALPTAPLGLSVQARRAFASAEVGVSAASSTPVDRGERHDAPPPACTRRLLIGPAAAAATMPAVAFGEIASDGTIYHQRHHHSPAVSLGGRAAQCGQRGLPGAGHLLNAPAATGT